MAVVETLEVRFRADMGDLSAQLRQLAAQVGGLSDALDAGRGNLALSVSALIRGVADALRSGAVMSSAPAEAGNALTNRFSQAILGGSVASASAARQVSGAAVFSNPAALASARSAGAALGQGFANGIASKYSAVMSAANRIANAAANRIRSALRIHSPSKVSFELGGYFGEGFADGIYASMRMAQQSVNALSVGARSTLAVSAAAPAAQSPAGLSGVVQAAVQEALGGTSIVIPLHVDGMKLGEASIEGINRVTRSTGRVMLEI